MRLRLCAALPQASPTTCTTTEQVLPIHALDLNASSMRHVPVLCSCPPGCIVRSLAVGLLDWAGIPINTQQTGRLTLRVTLPDGQAWIADPLDPVRTSGITEGVCVEPQLWGSDLKVPHRHPPVALLQFRATHSQPVTIPLVAGINTVGRDDSNRVVIPDARVSRVHATLACTHEQVTVHDHRSQNGTTVLLSDQITEYAQQPVRAPLPVTVSFGGVHAELTAVTHRPKPAHSLLRTRWRRPSLAASTTDVTSIQIPEIPADPPAQRFPIISALAPAAVGAALYLATHSLISLVGIAVSPVIVVGSWLEQWWSRRRAHRRNAIEYRAAIADVRSEINRRHLTERALLEQRFPHFSSCLRGAGMPAAGTQLSTAEARPTVPAGLCARYGIGSVKSVVTVEMPSRVAKSHQLWSLVDAAAEHARTLDAAPRCVTFANDPVVVLGDRSEAASVARAIVVQLLAQHSATELRLCVFTSRHEAVSSWSWAAWLPHTMSPGSTTELPRIVSEDAEITRVLSDIEEEAFRAPHDLPIPHTLLFLDGSSDTLFGHVEQLCRLAHSPHCSVLANASHLSAPVFATATVLATNADPTVASWDQCSVPEATQFAAEYVTAQTSQLTIRQTHAAAVPAAVSFSSLAPFRELRSLAHQESRWQENQSLCAQWDHAIPFDPLKLSAVIGSDGAEEVTLELRSDGPHALVAGTTGSGKSAFLQSWILSLAASYAPDRLNFFLIDFKGGAAFADCARLPHAVGFVTDLSMHLMRRAHTALTAEIRVRERCLSELGAPDLETLEVHRDRRAPPSLVVVIDECAVLFREYPPFRDTLQDIAQRGRSLGIHLILATQRPTGVISEQLQANITIRVALRVTHASESHDVLGHPHAAHISQHTPGRCYLRVGATAPHLFQSAYAGGPAAATQSDTPVIESFNLAPTLRNEATTAHPRPTGGAARVLHPSQTETTEIARIIERICSTAKLLDLLPPRAVWCPPLPNKLHRRSLNSGANSNACGLTLGLLDEPAAQRQEPFIMPLHQLSNVLVTGASRTGKSHTLCAIAAEVMLQAPATWVYLCVSGSETGLGAGHPGQILVGHAGFGGVVPVADVEHFKRALTCFEGVQQRQRPQHHRPHLVILIDDLGALRETFKANRDGLTLQHRFSQLLKKARNGDVSILAAISRSSNVPSEWLDQFSHQFHHRPIDRAEAHFAGFEPDTCSEAALPPGRALIAGAPGDASRYLQVPLFHSGRTQRPPDLTAHSDDHCPKLLVWPTPPPLPPLPARFHRSRWALTPHTRAWFALDLDRFSPISPPRHGLCVITGPPSSGRSSALRTLIECVIGRAKDQATHLTTVLLSRENSDLSQAAPWQAHTPHIFDALKCIEHSDTTGQTLIVIEATDAAEASTRTDSQIDTDARLSALCTLLGTSSDRVLILYESPIQFPKDAWQVQSVVQRAPWVLWLRPDVVHQSGAFGSIHPKNLRGDFTAGRGILVSSGQQFAVQVALPEGSSNCAEAPC